jgi:hypothetical protein
LQTLSKGVPRDGESHNHQSGHQDPGAFDQNIPGERGAQNVSQAGVGFGYTYPQKDNVASPTRNAGTSRLPCESQ